MNVPNFLILLILFTLLSSSITSALTCPGGQDQFLVVLKSQGLLGIELTLAAHILFLLSIGLRVEKFKSEEGIFGDNPDPTIVTDISVVGVNGMYIACLSPNLRNVLLVLPEV